MLHQLQGRSQAPPVRNFDAAQLAKELRATIRGEVRFDGGSRALYARAGANYRQVPLGVVIPKSADDVVKAISVCHRHGAPILSRGGGTGLAGQTVNVAVVIDFSKYMNRIIELDPARKRARVEPGIILDQLRNAAEHYHLTFGPDPSTHLNCTIGGMIGNNSCGAHSVMAGRTAENVEELEILTYDGHRMRVGATPEAELERIISGGGEQGKIYARLKELRDRYADAIRSRYPQIPRRVSGYNLDELLPEKGFNVARALVGTEGTCVSILQATVRLIDSPPARSLLVLGYPDVYCAGDHIPEILGFKPIALEGLDDVLVGDMKRKGLHTGDLPLLPDGRGWLMVEFGGQTKDEADALANRAMAVLSKRADAPSMKLYDRVHEEKIVWEIRESGLGATALVPGEKPTWEGWEDAAVPPERLGAYLRDFHKLLDQFGHKGALYGHFGQGCVHTRIDFDLKTRAGIDDYHNFVSRAADLVIRYGGSLSGEHGDGQSRAELLPRMFGDEIVQAFREFKAIWDPERKMNPHKVVDPYSNVDNLRLGTDYAPPQVKTHFQFPEDQGSFAAATLRCVGVGKCRRVEGGTMCPSFMVTREEMHSTRGRAQLLFEMLQGNPIRGRWRDRDVREALDLCLACKGCKGDCPVNVDMATYKAEFLSHFYRGRVRPIAGYSMGLIHWWSRLAAHAPALANVVTQSSVLGGIFKSLGGIAPQRSLPPFARETFREWFNRHARGAIGERPVILWPDTFNNYFHPEVARAASEVLELAGFDVTIPRATLCCGRPLYDFGMLALAQRLLRRVLESMRPEIRAGVPVICLEPSCASVFRDELLSLFPHDEDAKRLAKQTFTLDEFLAREGYQPPRLEGHSALLHGHCHHKSVLNFDSENELLEKMGIRVDRPESGCCGMAGSFGFEREHYEISMKIGERVLLPAVRSAPAEQIIIADGFSCRTQIEQATGRSASHIAEVIQLAFKRPRQDSQ